MTHAVSAAEMLVEEIHGTLSREFCSRLVVTRGRVVVKGVLRSGIEVDFVPHFIGLQRRLECGPTLVDALVVLRVMNLKRRPDLGTSAPGA